MTPGALAQGIMLAALLNGPGPSPVAHAADCGVCTKKGRELSEQKAELADHVKYLGKNQEYLAVLSSKEASKILKVKGNEQVILEQMDVIKGKINRLNTELEKEGCDQCKTIEGK